MSRLDMPYVYDGVVKKARLEIKFFFGTNPFKFFGVNADCEKSLRKRSHWELRLG
jgi:hypothetical protein